MKYSQFILEYILAGLITLTALLFLCSGFDPSLLPNHLFADSATSLAGVLILSAIVTISYPLGYGIYGSTMHLLSRPSPLIGTWGRKRVYSIFNESLHIAIHTRLCYLRAQFGNLEAGADFDRDWESLFSTMRLELQSMSPELYASISQYWTRLSRALATMAGALLFSGLILVTSVALFGLARAPWVPDYTYYLAGGPLLILGVVLLLVLASAIATKSYIWALRTEVRKYYQAYYVMLETHCDRCSADRAWVFTYGSNMCPARLNDRIEEPYCGGVARLHGFEVAYKKRSQDESTKATLINSEEPESSVWGVVYSIAEAELGELDEFEDGYERCECKPKGINGRVFEAVTYIAMEEYIAEDEQPYEWYRDLVVAGARQWRLPEGYVQRELASVKARRDPNTGRRSEAQDWIAACSEG